MIIVLICNCNLFLKNFIQPDVKIARFPIYPLRTCKRRRTHGTTDKICPSPTAPGVKARWYSLKAFETGSIFDIHAMADRGKEDVVGPVRD